MRYENGTTKFKHPNFEEYEAPYVYPQSETFTEAVDYFKGEDAVLKVLNAITKQRCLGTPRQKIGDATPTTREAWIETISAALVGTKDYRPDTSIGVSRKASLDMLDAIKTEGVESLKSKTPAELLELLAKLTGQTIS